MQYRQGFSGDGSRNAREAEFLEALAGGIASWTFDDVALDSFDVLGVLVPLVVMLTVPGIESPGNSCTLQVGFWDNRPDGPLLEGEWGNSYVLDSSIGDGELRVVGVDATPSEYGLMAAHWFAKQLSRPVERLDWLRHDHVISSRWRLADTGTTIFSVGRSIRPWMGQPQRVTRAR